MSIVSLNTIKNWFKTNLKPTQDQFWDTWDSFRHKSDSVPYAEIEGLDAVLLEQNNKINALSLPDIVLKEGVITVSGLTIYIVDNDFQWRLNQVSHLETPAYSQLLVAATEGFKRTDILEGDASGNYFVKQGVEGEFAAPAPSVTVGRIRLGSIPVFGSTIGTPDMGSPAENTPTDKPISVYSSFDKGISLYKDKISIWRYIGVVSKFINIYWSNINNIYDIQFPNKPEGSEQTFAMLSDLDTKHPYNLFKFVQKGFGNTDLQNDELGDIFCGWSDDGTLRYPEAKWLGGPLNTSNSFKPLLTLIIEQ